MKKNPVLSQTCANMLTAVRAQISLLNRIRGSNERNEVVDLWRGAYWLAIQEGKDPQALIKTVLEDYGRRLLKEIVVEQGKAAGRTPTEDSQKALASRVLKSLK